MKTLADLKKEFISGAEQIREDEYLDCEGVPRCKNCNTPRIHIMPDRIHAIRGLCDCQYLAIKEAKEREAREQMLIDYSRRKQLAKVPEKYAEITFKTFQSTDSNRAALEKCIRYLNNSEQMRKDNIGLYIYGANSTGKTYLAVCLCNELLLQGWQCLFTSIADLIREQHSSYNYFGGVENSVVKRIKRYDFVFIDDFGKEFIGREQRSEIAKALERQLFAIINSRANAKKPTIFTSNYSKNELGGELHLDAAIVERVNEMTVRTIKLSGDNFRRAVQAEKSEQIKRLGI